MDGSFPDGISITFDTFSPPHTNSSTSSAYEDEETSEYDEAHAAVMSTPTVSTSSPFSHVMGAWYLGDIMDKIYALDAATGGRVRDVLAKLRSRAYAPVALDASWAVMYCSICHRYTTHDTAHHLCRICHRVGVHTTAKCPVASPFVLDCSFCGTIPTGHSTNDHCCVNCYARGQHSSCGISIYDVAVSWGSQVAPSSKPVLEFTQQSDSTSTDLINVSAGAPQPTSSMPTTFLDATTTHSPASASAQSSCACTFCGSTHHNTARHRCRRCHTQGDHRSGHCPAPAIATPSPRQAPDADLTPPDYNCGLCGGAHHDTAQHRCRRCHVQGQHRSSQCPRASTLVSTLLGPTQAMVTQYISRSKTLQDTLTSLTPWTAGATASAFLLSDMELRLRQTLQRLGLWGAGSQTPIGTPTNPPRSPYTTATASPSHATSDLASGSYQSVVVSYREGSSVVPDRIVKFMRLLMHTNVSTNAFHVVVHPNRWDDKRPGMVSPKSLPPSPRQREAYQAHMNQYTNSVLVGAKVKLLALHPVQPPPSATGRSI
ncbi:hypothetical protein, variant 1 [Aphanomyces invadans]|uniref:Uncharacterized protein n=1 Tax=Aphanomyces invadans TaxID=157072 RepID=A0A024TN77_9STRA|nr:hypothetical protein, variant 1 [Aphanomyces invadans]ETV95429.1 hypothetical protein, variant 1 [Aphanomyces invadans]|eukprot:XP_008876130.1 hypothetical protein, variant 1 [Aphanomyces invadans]